MENLWSMWSEDSKLSFSPTNLPCMSLDCGKRAEKPAVWGLNITWAALQHWTVPHILWLRCTWECGQTGHQPINNLRDVRLSQCARSIQSKQCAAFEFTRPTRSIQTAPPRMLKQTPSCCVLHMRKGQFLKICRRDSPEFFWSVKTVCLSNLRLMKICRSLVNFSGVAPPTVADVRGPALDPGLILCQLLDTNWGF